MMQMIQQISRKKAGPLARLCRLRRMSRLRHCLQVTPNHRHYICIVRD